MTRLLWHGTRHRLRLVRNGSGWAWLPTIGVVIRAVFSRDSGSGKSLVQGRYTEIPEYSPTSGGKRVVDRKKGTRGGSGFLWAFWRQFRHRRRGGKCGGIEGTFNFVFIWLTR